MRSEDIPAGQSIRTTTFACELCHHIHTSGEGGSWIIRRFECEQIGDQDRCVARQSQREAA